MRQEKATKGAGDFLPASACGQLGQIGPGLSHEKVIAAITREDYTRVRRYLLQIAGDSG